VDAPDKPNTLEGEKMEMSGKEGEIGPYKNPKSFSAILSGNMEGGLLNTADTGMREPMKALAEKKKAAADKVGEEIKEMKAMQGKYANLEETCSIVPGTGGSGGSSSARVSGSSLDCRQAQQWINSCGQSAMSASGESAESIKKQIEELESDKKPYLEALKDKKLTTAERLNINKEIKAIDDQIKSLESKPKQSTDEQQLKNIISSLESYVDDAKLLDKSVEVKDLGDQVEAFFGANDLACKKAKEKLQSCSDHLKDVYTEEHKGSESGAASGR